MPTYTLTIKNGTKSDEMAFQKLTTVDSLGKATLISLKIKKEMYTPAHIEAVLQIELAKTIDITEMSQDSVTAAQNSTTGTQNSATATQNIDYKSMLGRFVDLSDGTKVIAKDYIIFAYVPEYKPSNNGTALYLKLNIYSPEKVLSYYKYNKCYVAKKLGADIFKEIAAKHPKEIKSISATNLQHTFIKDADGKDTEFIQPYLVQYEETALDFLARSANRCGEFLYYEDGTWQLGFKASTAIDVTNFSSLTFKNITEKEEENYYTTNYLKTESEQSKLNADLVTRNYTGPKDEYLDVLIEGESDFKNSIQKIYNFSDPSLYINNVYEWLKKTSFMEMVTTAGFDIGKNVLQTKLNFKNDEEKWTKDFITPYLKNKEQSSEISGKKVACQFSNYNACEHFDKGFYTNIKKLEAQADIQAIHINFDTFYQSLLLGDTIKVLGNTYVITKISATCQQNTSMGNAGQYTTYEIDAIPTIKGSYYPPTLKKQTTKSVTQTAFVSDNNDPCNLGRIQIRYPWQPETDKPSSPWIRVSQAFASKDAGISFRPQVGDEIMVGYEFGEIERPFMMGAFASKERKLNVGENKSAFLESSVEEGQAHTFYKNEFVIKSLNGHYIKFDCPDKPNMAKTFSPALNTWLSYLPKAAGKVVTDTLHTKYTDVNREFGGGIKMSDAYGIVKLDMSTGGRKITISSAMGDVKIDAFTGITISAPNGDVKIEGKNVSIVAGNNLTLKSGENVKKMAKQYNKKNFAHIVKGNIIDKVTTEISTALKVVDLKLLRTVLDSFMKPIGGTMLIKSQRFIRMEAGKGTTKLPYEAYKKDSKTQKKDIANKVAELKVLDTISSTIALIKNCNNFNNNVSKDLNEAKAEYNERYRVLSTRLYNAGQLNKIYPKYDNNPVKEKSSEKFFKKFTKNVESDEDIIKLGLTEGSKKEDSHKKIDKWTYSRINDSWDINGQLEAFKNAAEKLFRVAKAVNGNTAARDAKINASVKCHNETFITKVDNLNKYKDDIKGYLKTTYESIMTQRSKFNNELGAIAKREIVYDVLQKLKEKKYIVIENEGGLLNFLTTDHIRNTVKLDKSVCNTAEDWKNYIKCIKPEPEAVSYTKKFFNFVAEGFLNDMYTPDWEVRNIYNPEISGGEILFSDSDGNTRTIKGDTITSIPVSPVKNAVKDMKDL